MCQGQQSWKHHTKRLTFQAILISVLCPMLGHGFLLPHRKVKWVVMKVSELSQNWGLAPKHLA